MATTTGPAVGGGTGALVGVGVGARVGKRVGGTVGDLDGIFVGPLVVRNDGLAVDGGKEESCVFVGTDTT